MLETSLQNRRKIAPHGRIQAHPAKVCTGAPEVFTLNTFERSKGVQLHTPITLLNRGHETCKGVERMGKARKLEWKAPHPPQQ